MNTVFLAIVLVSVGAAAWGQVFLPPAAGGASPMEALSRAMIQSAAGAVDLALGLVGVMTLCLGLVKVAEAGGLLRIIAQLIRPLMVRLFPGVPGDHPAMGAMILNLSANVMGLGNAATPFGIRAMQELDRLNPVKGTATNSMVLFLAINTAGLAVIPTGVLALRSAAGSKDPAGIGFTTWFASAARLVQQITQDPDAARRDARDRFLGLLRSGGSNFPMEQLKVAGVDLSQPDTVRVPLTHVKVFGWYDNEMGSYTYRLGELTIRAARSL